MRYVWYDVLWRKHLFKDLVFSTVQLMTERSEDVAQWRLTTTGGPAGGFDQGELGLDT
jgi:hypothetical protein